jgi:hypothetical protein
VRSKVYDVGDVGARFMDSQFKYHRSTTPTLVPSDSSIPPFPSSHSPKLEERNARQGFFERGELLVVLAALPDDGLRDFVEWASRPGCARVRSRR